MSRSEAAEVRSALSRQDLTETPTSVYLADPTDAVGLIAGGEVTLPQFYRLRVQILQAPYTTS